VQNLNWRGWKPTEEAEPEPTGNGELQKNPGEKPGKAADKRLEAGREVVTEGERPQREKTVDDGAGRNSEVHRGSSGRVESPAIFAFGFHFLKGLFENSTIFI